MIAEYMHVYTPQNFRKKQDFHDHGAIRDNGPTPVGTPPEAMTRLMAEQARASALPGTTIIPATPAFGPASVESILQSPLSAVGVVVDGVPAGH